MYVVVTEPQASDDDPTATVMCETTGHCCRVRGHGPHRPAHSVPWVPWESLTLAEIATYATECVFWLQSFAEYTALTDDQTDILAKCTEAAGKAAAGVLVLLGE